MRTREFDLVVIGDANPDLILSGGELEPAFGQRERLVGSSALVLGGSGAITACGAARLGLRTAMVACVGDDVLGGFMLTELAAAGVDVQGVLVLPGVPTGISVALARPDDRAVLTALGAMGALDPAGVPTELLTRTRHLHIASPFLQPGLRDGLALLVARAHDAGTTVSLDTGWDPEDCWTQVLAALATVDVLLPNAQEVVRLASAVDGRLGTEGLDAADAATALAAGGPLVVAKLGADGALAVRDGAVVRVAAPRVDTVDAVGAGDSFDAGFLTGWLEGLDLVDALTLACACGALSTRRSGGTAGQPTRAEAEAMAGVAP
ncbi:MAG TPA: sugar kinase [Mycobacteriales bacterium]